MAPRKREIEHSTLATQQLDSLSKAWLAQRTKLEESSPANLNEFTGRLIRSWAIETGILERLYDLDAGATKTLIEHGFRADFIERGASGMDPEALVRVLKDHQDAAEMVLHVVAQQRPLTKHFIRELHQLLTRNQLQTEAVTPAGDPVVVPLEHGGWKNWPNNPLRPDGTVHEYAPPEQVESEIDRLVTLHDEFQGGPPAVVAAWLHHRFTQIHPFQDGNGRVARALTNYIFVKAGLFPLVVHRQDRVEYIAALETADRGDLRPLIDLFADVQARTLLDVLSVAKDEQEHGKRTALDTVVGKLTERFGKRIQDRRSVLRSVNDIARALRDDGASHLTKVADKAVAAMNRKGASLRTYNDRGGIDFQSEHFWKLQLVEIANEHSYWINFAEGQYWLRIAINGGPVEFRYVASLHHVGRDLTGAVRASAFAEFDVPGAPAADGGPTEQGSRLRQSCTPTLFSFTWQSDVDTAIAEFRTWLEESFAMALRRWMDLF